jgi:autoinducer 2-degrading protein
MLIVLVQVRVKAESIDAFIAATTANAHASREERGVARFDVIQQSDDASRFVLIEAYRSNEAALEHKETAHYKTWRDAVAAMMAEPRSSVKYSGIDPTDARW